MPKLALKLVAVFEAYFQRDEVQELAALFEVSLENVEVHDSAWLPVAGELVRGLDVGNNRRLVDAVLELASSRNSDGVAHTSFERREFHSEMAHTISAAYGILQESAAPSEVSVPAGGVFSAKSRVRQLLDTARGDILIVDPYIGVGTLDCLRDLAVLVRILTGASGAAIESGFDRAMSEFIAEGHQIEVRRRNGLHDRHLIFNDRCWLVGGSLKDAGKKPFNCIEIVDKSRLIQDIEAAWSEAHVFRP